MSDAPRKAYERLGGRDAELYALARLYLEFRAALPGPSDSDNPRARQLESELEEKGIEIINAYGRKAPGLDKAGHLVSLPAGDVHISWKQPELWEWHRHELVEDGDNLIEKLGIITLNYVSSENGMPLIHSLDLDLERVERANYRPSGFPKWGQPSIAEKLFGSRGKVKYAAEELIKRTGWGLRRTYYFDTYKMEAYLMDNDKWLECDIAPLRTQRLNCPLYAHPYHFINGESTAQVGPKVLSEDQARKLAAEKNHGYFRAHRKEIAVALLGFAIGIAGLLATIFI